MEPTAEFGQLQLGFVDQTQWRYELIRPCAGEALTLQQRKAAIVGRLRELKAQGLALQAILIRPMPRGCRGSAGGALDERRHWHPAAASRGGTYSMADILYGMNTHLPPPEHLDRLVAAGLRVARVDFNWAFIQPAPDRYEWAQTDQLLAEAEARTLWLYPTLAHPPGWASGGGDWNSLPISADLWYGFVASVVSRYRERISAWSLWNEPNQGPITPAQYVNVVLEPGARAIRTYAPGSLVCGPELATEGDWPSWLRQCLQRGGTFLDAVSVHSYQRNGREVVRALLGEGWQWPWEDPPVVTVLQRAGMAETPLLLTETGWNTARVSEEEQASYYDQLLEALQGRAAPALVLGYQLVDEPAPEQWGVMREDLSPKPAYTVIQRWLTPVERVIA